MTCTPINSFQIPVCAYLVPRVTSPRLLGACALRLGGKGGQYPSTALSCCYPCGNFSDTSSLTLLKTKGSIGHAFMVCIHTENENQMSCYPFVLHAISVLIKLTLGHLRCDLIHVLPQSNSQPDGVLDLD